MFNRTNSKELVGKTGVWNDRFEAVSASYFIRLRLDETRVLPTHVWAFMNSTAMKQRLFAAALAALSVAESSYSVSFALNNFLMSRLLADFS